MNGIDAAIERYHEWVQQQRAIWALLERLGVVRPPLHKVRAGYKAP